MKGLFTANMLIAGLFQGLYAQQLVVTSGGETTASGKSSVSFTIGQVFDQVNQLSAVTAIEGMQQPFEVSGALPVTLIYFRAAATAENTVDLAWSTASEVNNSHFDIERSSDGKKFSKIKRVAGSGDKHQTSTYTSIDKAPLSGVSYYRLKQTDFDGTYAYSRIIAVELKGFVESIATFPNPATDQIIVKLDHAPLQPYGFELLQNNGQVIKEGMLYGPATTLDVSQLTAGIYLLRVKGLTPQTFKIVKL